VSGTRNSVFVQREPWHQSSQIMADDSQCFLCIDTCANLIGDINTISPSLILAEMKGCQVSLWFVGKWSTDASRY